MKKNKIILFFTFIAFCFLSIFFTRKITSVNYDNFHVLSNFIKTYKADGGCYLIINVEDKNIIDEACIKINRNISIGVSGFIKSFNAIASKTKINQLPPPVSPEQVRKYIFNLSDSNTIRQLAFTYTDFLQNKNNYIEKQQWLYIKNILTKNVKEGTAKKTNINKINIGGLTSTIIKPDNNNITAFLGNFSYKKQEYVIITLLVSPKGLEKNFGYNSAGWNAVPLAAELIKNIMGD